MNHNHKLHAALVAGLIAALTTSAATTVDPDLADYQRSPGISGKLNAVGSDTLNNLMSLWISQFKEVYPNVKIQVEGKGSATAPPALIQGSAQLGPMSREMKPSEIDDFVERFGYAPTAVPVALDALAVFINKDNPLEKITLQELDAAFSNTYKRGGKPVTRWGDLGLRGQFYSRPISLYGRNSASGTYSYFKSVVLSKGDYAPTVKEQIGSSSVVQSVASDLFAIGYSGIGYKTSGVRMIALASEPGGSYYEPTYENALNGNYPLARFLIVYVNKQPGVPLDNLTLEFFKFVLSKQGQEIVTKDGYYPLPAAFCEKTLAGLSN